MKHNKTNEAQRKQDADAIRQMERDYMAKHRPKAKVREWWRRKPYQIARRHKTVDEYIRDKGLIKNGT